MRTECYQQWKIIGLGDTFKCLLRIGKRSDDFVPYWWSGKTVNTWQRVLTTRSCRSLLSRSERELSENLRFSSTIVQEELMRRCNYLIEATSTLSVPNSLTIIHSHYALTVPAFICCKFTCFRRELWGVYITVTRPWLFIAITLCSRDDSVHWMVGWQAHFCVRLILWGIRNYFTRFLIHMNFHDMHFTKLDDFRKTML